MFFPLIMSPQCRVYTLACSWWQGFHHFSKSDRVSFRFKVLASHKYGADSRYNRAENRRYTLTTQYKGKAKDSLCTKTTFRHEISDEINVSKVDAYKSEITELETIEYHDIRQKIVENKELAKLVTLIVFDIETTGFSRENERIIEIALRDLGGGENSTFQTLVNPGRDVLNEHIHGISTQMVRRAAVPRMEDLIPILLQYVRSRQKPGGYVVWIAHNARTFDVPFLISELRRCSYSIPSNWLFIDTLPLAREAMKKYGGGSKGGPTPKVKLQVLREHYKIPLDGSAHRAMSDVNLLTMVFQILSFELKLTLSELVGEHSVWFSEVGNSKNKKNNSSKL
ncbi:PREDICTED: exonuclease DPD1, chloroplastic/mitochondrial isoform X2 [Ipomoea nil]|uniref:exonuclease DPD1, chloroplastic/mitochondrial isoform X2 n=1 Tax=Ipomoea nil TaxID=35883 RepID=UPI000901C172|nr:PREDICTED: exonuclease DPD1, chloroplastic/mitochondrial isoform X2 [Ipomoea nil]